MVLEVVRGTHNSEPNGVGNMREDAQPAMPNNSAEASEWMAGVGMRPTPL